MITRTVGGELQMRCLSLKQPYLHFMFDLPAEYRKTIENRTRSVTKEMGPLLMAASAKTDRAYFETACEHAQRRGVPGSLLPRYEDLELGVLYGALRFVTMLPTTSLLDVHYPWKFPEHVGYVCRDAVRLPARPVSGMQGIHFVTLTAEEQWLLHGARLLHA
jgi:hypothetical protein